MSVAGSMLRQWQLVSQPAECKENCPSGQPTISIMLLYPFSTLRKDSELYILEIQTLALFGLNWALGRKIL